MEKYAYFLEILVSAYGLFRAQLTQLAPGSLAAGARGFSGLNKPSSTGRRQQISVLNLMKLKSLQTAVPGECHRYLDAGESSHCLYQRVQKVGRW